MNCIYRLNIIISVMYVESLVVASSLIMNTKTLEQALTDIICYSCQTMQCIDIQFHLPHCVL